jgi:hypothetical protein
MDLPIMRGQFAYDSCLAQLDETSRESQWVENAVEQLMMGGDIGFKRRLHSVQGITFEQFAVAVDEFALEQLSGCGVSPSVLGRLVLAARRKASADAASVAAELLDCPDPDERLAQIARRLLSPLARDALIAEEEDNEL